MALAASPSRKPKVPGLVAVGRCSCAVNRGRCTMSSRNEVIADRSSSATPKRHRPCRISFHSGEPRSEAGRKRVPCVGQRNSLSSSCRLIRQGRAAMHSSKTWRTGSIPMTFLASSRVSRMFRNPSPRSS